MIHVERFQSLTNELRCHRSYWYNSPFYNFKLGWREALPELNQACLALSDSEFDALDQSPVKLSQFLSHYIPGYEALNNLTAFPVNTHSLTLQPRLNMGVPGRKWQQIEAFANTLPAKPLQSTRTFVDWCSGKSYMGRAVADYWRCGLHAVERNPALCESGLTEAQQWLNTVAFSQKDVLLDHHPFHHDEFVVALHACGDLHRRLLHQWRGSDSRQLALVPCCYHQWLHSETGYTPISQAGLTYNLGLTKNQVRLAVQEMVTASQAVRQQVRQLGEWRMAFDLIQRDLRGVDEYLPTQSISYSRVKRGAQSILNDLAKQKNLAIPTTLNLDFYVNKAKIRYAQFLRLQLVSQGFRRALELWLVLDLVLFLEEAGCGVDLTCFCEREITPRNFRILALRE